MIYESKGSFETYVQDVHILLNEWQHLLRLLLPFGNGRQCFNLRWILFGCHLVFNILFHVYEEWR